MSLVNQVFTVQVTDADGNLDTSVSVSNNNQYITLEVDNHSSPPTWSNMSVDEAKCLYSHLGRMIEMVEEDNERGE